MQAFDEEGRELIEASKHQFGLNQKQLIKFIQQAQDEVKNKQLDQAKEHVIKAMELALESSSLVYISVDGLKALVFNEKEDAQKHLLLTECSDQLYDVFCSFFKLAPEITIQPNVVSHHSFQLIEIEKSLARILQDVINL